MVCLAAVAPVKDATIGGRIDQAGEAPLGRQLLRQQMLLYGRLVRAPNADPLGMLTFIPGTTYAATNRFVQRVGRPRSEWTNMLEKEVSEMGRSQKLAIHIESEWRSAVYQHCIR